jgi:hypothetical protein
MCSVPLSFTAAPLDPLDPPPPLDPSAPFQAASIAISLENLCYNKMCWWGDTALAEGCGVSLQAVDPLDAPDAQLPLGESQLTPTDIQTQTQDCTAREHAAECRTCVEHKCMLTSMHKLYAMRGTASHRTRDCKSPPHDSMRSRMCQPFADAWALACACASTM